MARETARMDPLRTLWSGAWKLYIERFSTLVQILLPPVILVTIANLLKLRGPAGAVLGGLISLIGALAFVIASIALIFALYEKTDFGTAYRKGFALFWPFAWLCILTFVVVVGGFVMLIVPGIFLGIALSVAQYVFVVEGKRGIGALAQSWQYVKGYWWAVLGRTILLGIAFGFTFAVIGAVFTLLLGPVGSVLVTALLILFAVPYGVSYKFAIFENLRRIKPALAASEAKEGRGFLVASGIVGLVAPILIFILIVVALGFGAFRLIHDAAQNGANNPANPFANPLIFNLDPAKGPVGTSVAIYGISLAATNTVEIDNLVDASLRDLTVAKNGTLTFVVPESVGPDCQAGEVCAQFLKQLTPGTYNVDVVANGVRSNAIPFTVTAE